MSNYKDWIKAVDIQVDYYSAFMKAWIAFNAWYESGEIEGKTDKDKIDYIAYRSNRFKTYIENLLTSEDTEGISFRESVGKLHNSLLNASITTQEYVGVRQAISFSSVAIKNKNNLNRFEYFSNQYKCERARGKIITTVSKRATGVELFRFEQEEYNKDELIQQSTFLALTATQQNKCEECYRALEPYIIESIIDPHPGDHSKKMGAYNFISDTSKICSAIVVVLYLLRCGLAHGDVSPDEASSKVYRYAYEVLVPPLKKLN